MREEKLGQREQPSWQVRGDLDGEVSVNNPVSKGGSGEEFAAFFLGKEPVVDESIVDLGPHQRAGRNTGPEQREASSAGRPQVAKVQFT